MGKYEYLINKAKVDHSTMLNEGQARNEILTKIANELAEANRLRIIELKNLNHFDKLMNCWDIDPKELEDKA